jgi:hypothetical protein
MVNNPFERRYGEHSKPEARLDHRPIARIGTGLS